MRAYERVEDKKTYKRTHDLWQQTRNQRLRWQQQMLDQGLTGGLSTYLDACG
jgi:hypothetical protein